MNKKNKILVGCLALLLALSVGYALFSDTITINGTATAKGNFDIKATCETGISSNLGTVTSLGLAAEGGYENDTCSVVDDTVSLSVNFSHPGARRYFTIKHTNIGTISAILNMKEIVTNSEFCHAENKEGNNQSCNINSGYSSYISSNDEKLGAGINVFTNIVLADNNGNIMTSEQMLEFVDMENLTITLLPNYSAYYISFAHFDHESTQPSATFNEFFVKYTTTIDMPYKQVSQ